MTPENKKRIEEEFDEKLPEKWKNTVASERLKSFLFFQIEKYQDNKLLTLLKTAKGGGNWRRIANQLLK